MNEPKLNTLPLEDKIDVETLYDRMKALVEHGYTVEPVWVDADEYAKMYKIDRAIELLEEEGYTVKIDDNV